MTSERYTFRFFDSDSEGTALQFSVKQELALYFEMLEGQTPRELHDLVMGQVEAALFDFVMHECRGNQSKAAQWLGISRGTLRSKIALMERQRTSAVYGGRTALQDDE